MKNLFTVFSVSAFLVCSGISALAAQSDRSNRMQSDDSQSMQQPDRRGSSSIESQNRSGQSTEPSESEEQKGSRPGGVGENDPATSMFGSPSTMPPGETSPGYTGADKEAKEQEKRRQGM